MTDPQPRPGENEQHPEPPFNQMILTGHAEIIRDGQVVVDDPDCEEPR